MFYLPVDHHMTSPATWFTIALITCLHMFSLHSNTSWKGINRIFNSCGFNSDLLFSISHSHSICCGIDVGHTLQLFVRSFRSCGCCPWCVGPILWWHIPTWVWQVVFSLGQLIWTLLCRKCRLLLALAVMLSMRWFHLMSFVKVMPRYLASLTYSSWCPLRM